MREQLNRLARLTAAAMVLIGSIWSSSVMAQLAVFDPANFGQSVITATNAVTSVQNQVQQIAYQVRMIDNQIKALQRLADGDFLALNGNLNQQMNDINRIVNTTRGIGFRVERIKGQFQEMFPLPQAQNLTETPAQEHAQWLTQLDQWHTQLMEASADSMEAQSAVERIQTSNNDTQRILATSMRADGQVRQLQSVNAMLGVLSGQMGDQAVVIATAARVTAVQASKESSEQAAERAALIKFMQPAKLLNDANDR